MREQNIPGIYGIDTRALTKIVRESGVMNGMILSELPEDRSAGLWDLKQYRITEAVANTSISENEVHLHTNETKKVKENSAYGFRCKEKYLSRTPEERM